MPLTPEQQALGSYFDDLVRRAEAPPPNRDEKNADGSPKFRNADNTLNADAWNAEVNKYKNNPLLPLITKLKEDSRTQATTTVAGGVPTVSDADAKAIYLSSLANVRGIYMRGVEKGAPDPDAAKKQEEMVKGGLGAAMDGNIIGFLFGAVKDLLFKIPFVKNLFLWIGSKFKGENLTMEQVSRRSNISDSLNGGAVNLGIKFSVEDVKDAIDYVEHPEKRQPAAETNPPAPIVVPGSPSGMIVPTQPGLPNGNGSLTQSHIRAT